MATAGEEIHRHQGDSVFPFREFSNDEAVPNSKLSSEVRPPVMLQRGHSGHFEVHGGEEVKLGGFKWPFKIVGMEHDRDSINDA